MGFFQSLFHPHHHKGGKELNSHHNGSKSSPTSPLVMPSLSTPATTTAATSPACSVPQSPPLAKAQSFLSPLAPPQLNPPTPSASTFTNNSSSSKNSITSPTHSRRPSQDIPRFQLLEDGTHIHHLTLPAPNRITASLNGLVTGIANKSLRLTSQWTTDRKITLEEIKKERDAVDARLHRTPETRSLQDKWGTCQEVIGKGTSGVVKIARKTDPVTNTEKLYAVKELRKRKDESAKDYITRLTSEFYMASTIHHPNIIQSYDLMPLNDVSPTFCQVMEFSGGGDLFDVLYDSPDGLDPLEANCFFKQLMRGVQYLHSVGVAHRDLKPENLLLTSYGCIKITDFGCAFCFQGTALDNEGNQLDDDDKKVHLIRGLVGSEPYIAPEEFTKDDYDARCVDVWSCGIIYMSMRKSAHLWRLAKKGEDESYDKYLKFRQLLDEERENAKRELSLRKKQLEKTMTDEERQLEKEKRAAGMLKARETIRKRAKEGRFDTLEGIDIQSKKIIYRMLDPQPSKRITAEEVVRSEWCENIYCCQPSS